MASETTNININVRKFGSVVYIYKTGGIVLKRFIVGATIQASYNPGHADEFSVTYRVSPSPSQLYGVEVEDAPSSHCYCDPVSAFGG